MEAELRILMVEDMPTDAELEIRELKRAGLRVTHELVDTEDGFRSALRAFRPNLIISDFSMPHFDGMFALALARELAPDVPFIFVSGTIGEEYAIRALKNGATDYVLKNNLLRLPASVERALQESKERAARVKMERELEETRSRLDSIVSSLPDVVWSVSPSPYRLLFASRAFETVWGIPVEKLERDPDAWLSAVHPDDRPGVEEAWRNTLAGKGMLDAMFRIVRGDQVRWIHDRAVAIRDPEGEMVRLDGLARDVTQLKEQEKRIERLSRIRAVLSGINSAIVRIRDTQQLFNEACRIAVEHGNFGIAWIGHYDAEKEEVIPVASAGVEGEYHLMNAKLNIASGSPTASGMIARSIRERRAVYSNDIRLEPEVGGHRRQEAIRRGYCAVCAMPLLAEGKVVGTLSLFAKEVNFFDDEEMKLLNELAGDISFALEHIAGQKRIEKLSRIRAISSEINAAIVRIRERDALLRETCLIACQQGKFDMVWIGTIDLDGRQVRPAAWAGFTAETAHAVSWATIESAQGPLGEAIRTKKVAVRNDIESAMPTGQLRQAAMKAGCLSTTCLPLVVDERVVGLISLYAAGRNAFDEDELALLGDVASNVSFALESIARQEKIDRLSRIRNVLGEMNAAIVRIRDKQQLFEEACRIAVEHGKFAMAWIGMLDEAAQVIRPAAKAGRDEGYLERLKLSLDPNITRHLTLAVEALGRSAPVICNDIATDGRMRAWREAALERGFRSTVMLPLVLEQRAIGVLALYAPEPGVFDEDEMKLLIEIAGDIAFALQTIAKQEKLDYLSYYDALTGLPNRALFNDRLEQRVSAAHRDQKAFSVMMLDIERFRSINDTLGRQAGDDLLRQIAERLKGALEETDILAHFGGDYFAITTRRTEEGEGVARLLEQILTSVSGQPFQLGNDELRISPRSGVVLYPADGASADSLLKNAEAALKNAKTTGNRFRFYAPQMNARVAEQLKLENDLRRSVLEERFVLYYQPRLDLLTGRISGLEALIRWIHPERGLVAPGEFIPIMENTGLILEVGRWALKRAALDHSAWRAAGLNPPRVAVNVSAIQLRRKEFVDEVKAAVSEGGDSGKQIDVEITESMLMEDIAGNIDKLKSVRAMGVQVAMDDFGTGYSSLSYLARLPINSLKIDRSFISQMAKAPEQMAIVSTVISLARALNLKVVAEGVETQEQANLLKLLRCDEVQGYLFGRPVPPGDLEGKLRQS